MLKSHGDIGASYGFREQIQQKTEADTILPIFEGNV